MAISKGVHTFWRYFKDLREFGGISKVYEHLMVCKKVYERLAVFQRFTRIWWYFKSLRAFGGNSKVYEHLVLF